MTSFQRARSEEQRLERRRQILDAATTMLAEMPAAQMSLNELSRRAGLAKSNVLRYFESREAVLLELLVRAAWEWLAALPDALDSAIDKAADPWERGDRLAVVLTDALAAQPHLCELASMEASVLEHNVSPALVVQHKRETTEIVVRLTAMISAHLPELGPHDTTWFVRSMVMAAGATWTHSQPSASVLAAYEADLELAALRSDFASSLCETLKVLLAGLLARR